MTTKTKQETDLESIKSQMRLAITACNRAFGRVIVGSDMRIYVNMGTGNSYFVADRMSDNILRYAVFKNDIKQASWTPAVECTKQEWRDFLAESIDLAHCLGLRITATAEP